MENKSLQFLADTSDILTKELGIEELSVHLKQKLDARLALKELNLYIYDSVSNTIRNCLQDWCIIEDAPDIYEAFNSIKDNDFVINNKAYKLPATVGDISFKISSLFMPILKDEKPFGLIHLVFGENTSVNMEFLFLMKVFTSQVSLKLQNILLSEQSKINVEFHDSMKNIAKIIETQYDLNYIIPLIGEMIDKFISDHLIYIFLKQQGSFNLVWPMACRDTKILEMVNSMGTDTQFILAEEDRKSVV